MEVGSAKECVTTHLLNELALKMDGTQVCYPYSTVKAICFYSVLQLVEYLT